MPNPWGFVEVAKEAIENGGDNNYIGFSWFGEKEDPVIGQKKAYCCPECQNLIIGTIKRINKTFNREERKAMLAELYEKAGELECGHYAEFIQELNEIKRNKQKTPERRLHDYYETIINENTGAVVENNEGPEL